MRRMLAALSGCFMVAAAVGAASQVRTTPSALQSGIEAGAEVKSFEPVHVAGPNRGTRTCPVC